MFIADDEIISGFIGEAVSRCVDFSWTKIKEVVKNRKNNHQNIESQIYNVVVNVLNQLTYNKFENDQDKIYQAAEKLLIDYKDSRYDSIEGVKSGLQILGENVNSDKYIEYKNLLYQEISKDDYEELYRQIRLFQQDEESSRTSRIEQKIDRVQQSVDETNQVLSVFKESNREVDNGQNKKLVKSRTQEYADKWNENMFLNNFDKRDENAGVNIKLGKVYLEKHLPHYIWYKNTENNSSSDLKELLSDYINEKRDSKMLLIFGQPGIGKSTLITWITVNFIDRINDILVYKFASDLGNVDWKGEKISDKILEELNLTHSDLNGKTLILDGFDEVSIEANKRRDILDSLYGDWIYNGNIKNFSLIITCRENYVQKFAILKCKYITLQTWDEKQIKSFCDIYGAKTKNRVSENTIEKLYEKKEIFGLPLILYMVLALNISIEKEGSIVDIYDKIFSLDGGIYDRCIDNKMFADKHRIAKIKNQIHQISRELAIWIFENNSAEASISQEKYQEIFDKIIKKEKQNNRGIEQDILIGNFFKLVRHSEGIGTKELYFIHRSIYEYFVAETVFNSIEYSVKNLTEENSNLMAGNITYYLKKGEITYTITQYFEYKAKKLYNSFGDTEKLKFYELVQSSINKILKSGMFFYNDRNINEYKNILDMEINCFLNIVKVLKILFDMEKRYVISSINADSLTKYIRYYFTKCEVEHIKINLSNTFLRGINLKEANLQNVDLKYADLRSALLHGANLSYTDLTSAILVEADLSGANLSRATLKGAKIEEINLNGTDLTDTLFDEEQINYLECLKKRSSRNKFYLRVTRICINNNEIISYEEYYKK